MAASSQIIIDQISSLSSWSTNTVSFNHPIASQDAVLLIFATSDSGAIASVTFNGVPLTLLTGVTESTSGSSFRQEIWYMRNPAVGTHTVSVTGASGAGNCGATAISLLGVDKRVLTPVTWNGTTASTTFAFTVTPPAANSIIFDAHVAVYSTSLIEKPTNPNQVLLVSETNATSAAPPVTSLHSISYQMGGRPGVSETFNWTTTGTSIAWAAVALEPAQAPSSWFPNIDFRNILDVNQHQADAGAGTPLAFSEGYRPSTFFQNSFLHTVGRMTVNIASTITKRTQTGLSRITILTKQFQQGKARITQITTQAQLGIARITQISSTSTYMGKALQFDGSQNYLSLGTMGNFGSNFGSGVYCKFAIKTTIGAGYYFFGLNIGTTGLFIGLGVNYASSSLSGGILVNVTDDAGAILQGGTSTSAGYNDGNVHTIEIVVTPSTNTIVIKVDGTTQTISYYLQQTPHTFSNFGGNFYVGAQNNGLGAINFIPATIDNLLLGTSASNLYGNYAFDEGSGSTTADSSGNGNTGTLEGSPLPTWVTGLVQPPGFPLKGVSRITTATIQAQTGKSRITAITSQIQQGKSRITQTTKQIQNGLSRITQITKQVQSGVSRITATTKQFQSGLTRITIKTLQAQGGKSRITQLTKQIQSGLSRITQITKQAIPGLSRITALTKQIQNAVSRITVSTMQSVSGVSRVTIIGGTRKNFIPNPSFEVDTASWTLDGDFSRVSSDSYSGSYSIKQTSTSGYLNFTTQNDSSHKIAVIPGKTYTLSFYYKLTINSGFGPNFEIHDDTPYAGNVVASSSLSAATSWTQSSITFTAPSSGYVTFRLYNNNGSVVAYYDAFLLEQASSALSYFDGSYLFGSWEGTANNSISDLSTTRLAAIARITAVTKQIQNGVARITALSTQTQQGKARITQITKQVQSALSRISILTKQVQSALSRITVITLQTQSGKSRITALTKQIQSGISRITQLTKQTQSGVSRIAVLTKQAQTAITRITATTIQTQGGKSRVTQITKQFQQGISRITQTTKQTITGLTRITAATKQLQTGVARVTIKTTQAIQGTSRITILTKQTQTGLSRVTAFTKQTIAGLARITATTSKTQSALARIQVTTKQTLSGISKITAGAIQTITAVSRITVSTLKLQSTLARITVVSLGGVGRALQFSTANQNYVSLGGTVDPLRGVSAFSISAWIKGTNFSTHAHAIVANWQDTTVLFRVSGGSLQGFIKNQAGTQYGGTFGSLSTVAIYHVVLTWDGSNLIGYINAVAGTAIAASGTSTNTTSTTCLTIGGASRNSSEGYFDGVIDDVKLYNRALTQTDITNLYNQIPVTSGLINYWPLDDGSGTTATDSIGSNNGTLSGTTLPQWVNGLLPLTGRARITLATTTTLSAVSRVTAKAIQTITGLTRITATTKQTMTGMARITVIVTKTISGVARITVKTIQTQSGIAHILSIINSTTQTITGIARITTTTLKAQTGISRITGITSKTISALSRITAFVQKTQMGVARLTVQTAKTIAGLTRITVVTLRTQVGLVRITSITTKTQIAIARVSQISKQTISAVSRIMTQATKTITGAARVTGVTMKQQSGITRITVITKQIMRGVSRVTVSQIKTLMGKANLAAATMKTITGQARLFTLTRKTQAGTAHILSAYGEYRKKSEPFYSKGNLFAKLSRLASSKGSLFTRKSSSEYHV